MGEVEELENDADSSEFVVIEVMDVVDGPAEDAVLADLELL